MFFARARRAIIWLALGCGGRGGGVGILTYVGQDIPESSACFVLVISGYMLEGGKLERKKMLVQSILKR